LHSRAISPAMRAAGTGKSSSIPSEQRQRLPPLDRLPNPATPLLIHYTQ